jgi:hypothetical protein
VTGGLTAGEGDAGFGHLQEFGQDGATGGIRCASHGRGGQAEREAIGAVEHELVPGGTGLHADRQEDVRAGLCNGWMVGAHAFGAGFPGSVSSSSR